MDSDGLVVAFGRANQRVMDAAAGNPDMEGMGTTLVAAVENNGDLLIASVGDSRVYTFENGSLQTITRTRPGSTKWAGAWVSTRKTSRPIRCDTS